MTAYCIFMNDGIREVVLDNQELANSRLEELAKEYWDKNHHRLKQNYILKTYEEYRELIFWHIHDVNVYKKEK